MAFADTWGDMGPAWNVTPSVARVHGYLLAAGVVLTERDIREALGLSHRAASLALGELEEWQLVERVDDTDRPARPGPAAVAWRVVGDRWRWFQRVAEERRAREADPLQPRLAVCLELANEAVTASPESVEALRLRDWIAQNPGPGHPVRPRAADAESCRDGRIARASRCWRRSPTRRSTTCCDSSDHCPRTS